MPPKDDDDPASTKEVVTKKQKQLLNREELDLNLIAESLGGYVVSEDFRSLTGDAKEIIKRIFGSVPRVNPGADPRDFLPDPESKVRNPKPKKPTPGGPRVNPGASPFDLSKQLSKKATERAAAEQQAAIDTQADKASGRTTPGGRPSPKKGFSDFVKSIKNVKPSSVGRVVRGAGRLVAPAYAAVDIAGRTSRGQSTVQSVAAPAVGWAGAKKGAALGASIMAPVPIPGARIAGTIVGGGLGYVAGAGLASGATDLARSKYKGSSGSAPSKPVSYNANSVGQRGAKGGLTDAQLDKLMSVQRAKRKRMQSKT